MKCDVIPKIKVENTFEESILYKDLLNNYNRTTAKTLYNLIHSDKFISWFGNWIEDKSLPNLDKNGEPKIIEGSFINSTGDKKKIKKIEPIQDTVLEQSEKLLSIFKDNNIDVEISLDDSIENSYVEGTNIVLNPNKLDKTTLPHEFSHIYVDLLGYKHPLIKKGIKEVKEINPTLWSKIQEEYKNENYSTEDLEKELLVTSMGEESLNSMEGIKYIINRIIRFFSNILGITSKTSLKLFNQMYNSKFDKNITGEITKKRRFQKLYSLEGLDTKNYDSIITDFEGSIMDISKSRKELGYSASDTYQFGKENPNYSKLEKVYRNAEFTRFGKELSDLLRSKKVDKNKIKILTSSPIDITYISAILGIPKNNIISISNKEIRNKYKLDEDVPREITEDSTLIEQDYLQRSAEKRFIIDSIKGKKLFIDDNKIFTESASDLENTDAIQYTNNPNIEELENLLGKDLLKNLLKVVEDEKIALERRLAYFESLKTDNPESKKVSEKSIKSIRDVLRSLRKKDAKEQFVIMVEKAISDLVSIDKYLSKNDTFNKLDYSTAKNLSFIQQFLDTYKLLDRQDFAVGDTLLSNTLSELNKLLNSVSSNFPEKLLDYTTTLINENTTNPKFKDNKNLIREELLQGEDIPDWDKRWGALASTSDSLLSNLDKIFKERQLEVLERNNSFKDSLYTIGDRLRKEGVKNFDWMINKDKGTIISKISNNYYEKVKQLDNDLKNEDGSFKKYKEIFIEDLATADKKDLDYNIDLKNKKDAKNAFVKPEVYNNKTKKLEDGVSRKYTEEFKQIRDKYEFFDVSSFEWIKRPTITKDQYKKYLNKYYSEEVEYLSPEYIQEFKDEEAKYEFKGAVDWKLSKFIKEDYIEPTENWINSEYKNLSGNKLNFYNLYLKEFNRALSKLPTTVSYSMKGRLPAISKHFIKRLSEDSNKLNIVGSSIKNSIIPEAIISHRRLDEKGNAINEIPMFYVSDLKDNNKIKEYKEDLLKLDPEKDKEEYDRINNLLFVEKNKLESKDLSTDLVDSLIKFMNMAENYEVMTEFEATAKLADNVINNKRYYAKDSKGNLIKDKKGFRFKESGEVNATKRLKDWLEMTLYQNTEENNTISAQVAKKVMKYASIRNLGLNWTSGINNLIIGGMNQNIEAWGEQFYSRDSYRKSTKILGNYISTAMFSELGKDNSYYKKDTPKHKLSAMMKDWDVLQDTREAGSIENSRGFLENMYDLGWAFKLNDIGEYANQSRIAVSMLLDYKIKDNKGNESNLWDAHEIKDGKFILKPSFSLSTRDKRDFINKIKGVNQYIHGRYTQEDRSTWQRHWAGQAAYHFKKWLGPAIESRFRKSWHDERIGIELEGRYRSVATLAKELYKSKLKLKDSWNSLTDVQKANMIKNAVELGYFTASVALLIAATSIAGDVDEDDYILNKSINYLVYQSSRQVDELSTFVNPIQAYKNIKDPFAAMGTIGEVGEFIFALGKAPYNTITGNEDKNIYQRGAYKDMNKVTKEGLDIIPFARLLNQWRRLDEEQDYYIK